VLKKFSKRQYLKSIGYAWLLFFLGIVGVTFLVRSGFNFTSNKTIFLLVLSGIIFTYGLIGHWYVFHKLKCENCMIFVGEYIQKSPFSLHFALWSLFVYGDCPACGAKFKEGLNGECL